MDVSRMVWSTGQPNAEGQASTSDPQFAVMMAQIPLVPPGVQSSFPDWHPSIQDAGIYPPFKVPSWSVSSEVTKLCTLSSASLNFWFFIGREEYCGNYCLLERAGSRVEATILWPRLRTSHKQTVSGKGYLSYSIRGGSHIAILPDKLSSRRSLPGSGLPLCRTGWQNSVPSIHRVSILGFSWFRFGYSSLER